jgi:hypothetical protein
MYRMTKEQKRLAAVHHVVHDYTNLVSSGTLTKTALKAPINTHVQHAFLLNCRKMAAFFLNLGEDDDILSRDFVAPKKVGFKLSWKRHWQGAMNKQLLHLTYSRIDKAKPWDGTPNEVSLREFQAAWKKFLDNVEEPYRSKFSDEIALKLGPKSEFRSLELR